MISGDCPLPRETIAPVPLPLLNALRRDRSRPGRSDMTCSSLTRVRDHRLGARSGLGVSRRQETIAFVLAQNAIPRASLTCTQPRRCVHPGCRLPTGAVPRSIAPRIGAKADGATGRGTSGDCRVVAKASTPTILLTLSLSCAFSSLPWSILPLHTTQRSADSARISLALSSRRCSASSSR